MKILILGIGNPILSDDGVGIYASRRVQKIIGEDKNICIDNVEVKEASVGGLGLLEMILGYDKVILIDAIMTKNGKVGEIYKLGLDNFKETLHASSAHDISFMAAIDIGKKIVPEKMPQEITIFAIEVQEVTTFNEELTSEVKKSIPQLVKKVIDEITKMDNN